MPSHNPLNSKFVRFGCILMILSVIFYNRDLINKAGQMVSVDNNHMQENQQQIVIQDSSMQIGLNENFMSAIEYHYRKYRSPFIIYKNKPDLSHAPTLCGTMTEIIFNETTLEDIEDTDNHKPNKKKIISGQKIDWIFPELVREIPYARKGDKIYGCKIRDGHPPKILQPKDIICQAIEIVKVVPETIMDPIIIKFIQVGNVNTKTQCNDTVSIEYKITTDKSREISNNKLEEIKIGHNQIPHNIELGLMRIGIGGTIVIESIDKVISFNSKEGKVNKNRQNISNNYTLDKDEKKVVFLIKRTA